MGGLLSQVCCCVAASRGSRVSDSCARANSRSKEITESTPSSNVEMLDPLNPQTGGAPAG